MSFCLKRNIEKGNYMQMPINTFKRALLARQIQIGSFLGLCNAYSAEIMALAGFDCLAIDGEHAPNTPAGVIPQLQAVASHGVQTLVRPVDHNPALIKQYLDVGVQTLLAPMVESAQQAQALASAMRYPPEGIRGVGTALARAAGWNAVPDYLMQANDQMCLIAQIENQAGLNALEDILAVDQVDAIFIGPSDLAASLGHLGNTKHPHVQQVIRDVLARASKAGKAVGIFCMDLASAASYRVQGASFFLVGADTLLLRNAATHLAGTYRDAIAGQQ
jgi:4-hydroxy-2-oxoheptanedioate aldolase